MNLSSSVYSNKFISDLINKFPNTYILLIHGTLFHDYNQLDSYSHYVSEKFRIYKNYTVEHILGLKILIIPEEYFPNKETYKVNLSDDYDFVFGHGMFDTVAFSKYETVKKNKIVFSQSDFKGVKGYILFGHIHTHTKDKKLIYAGSFPRFAHGEEEDKGFYYVKYDKKHRKVVYEEFVVNKAARKFVSVKLSDIIKNKDPLKHLNSLCDSNFRVRLIIDILIDNDTIKSLMHDIVGLSKNIHNLSITKDKTLKSKESDDDKDREKRKAELLEKINMYKNKDWMEITIDYTKREFNYDITKEDIIEARKEE